jgi:hypothetical protein
MTKKQTREKQQIKKLVGNIKKATSKQDPWEKRKQEALRRSLEFAAMCMINDELIPVMARAKAFGLDSERFVGVCETVADLWNEDCALLPPDEYASVQRTCELYNRRAQGGAE